MKKSLAHSVWECKYHIVWVPKNRRKIIYGKLRKDIGAILRRLCQYKGVEVIEGNACIDHIHVCLSIPPKYSVSEAVGFLKGKSAIKLFDLHHELKRRYWGRHFWAKGYCVSTIGLDEEQIRKYVRWQTHKDKKRDQIRLWK